MIGPGTFDNKKNLTSKSLCHTTILLSTVVYSITYTIKDVILNKIL